MKIAILISILAAALGGCQHNPQMAQAVMQAANGFAAMEQQRVNNYNNWRAANPVQQPLRLKTNCRFMPHGKYWACN